ncbi:MAG: Asp-tRNA(Asn)/Glu-tRNA(Gln) amidotransferase GatCAB subunit B, partial [Balneolaceae bacterium]
DFIEPIINTVVEGNPDEVRKYKEGKKQLIGFFIGQVMQQSKGKANPRQVRDLITDKLESN